MNSAPVSEQNVALPDSDSVVANNHLTAELPIFSSTDLYQDSQGVYYLEYHEPVDNCHYLPKADETQLKSGFTSDVLHVQTIQDDINVKYEFDKRYCAKNLTVHNPESVFALPTIYMPNNGILSSDTIFMPSFNCSLPTPPPPISGFSLPSINDLFGGKMKNVSRRPRRQPFDYISLLDLNRVKYNRWKSSIDFAKEQCGNRDQLLSFIMTLLEDSRKSNQHVQWLTETDVIQSPRCFEFKNTVEIAEMYSKLIGQKKSFKSISARLYLNDWTINYVKVLKKVPGMQRNRYELLPDLISNNFGQNNQTVVIVDPKIHSPIEILKIL
uniref:Uncharacterized protein n=1 Tax=Panagrolaimus sp. JU765 TaxID=591449 RepID=A0AC34QAV1_9BILA